MTQTPNRAYLPRRANSQIVPFMSVESQPISMVVGGDDHAFTQTPQENLTNKIQFQKLEVEDDFEDEIVDESNEPPPSKSQNQIADEIKKAKHDAAKFDQICEIDQITILPFYPVTFNH